MAIFGHVAALMFKLGARKRSKTRENADTFRVGDGENGDTSCAREDAQRRTVKRAGVDDGY